MANNVKTGHLLELPKDDRRVKTLCLMLNSDLGSQRQAELSLHGAEVQSGR